MFKFIACVWKAVVEFFFGKKEEATATARQEEPVAEEVKQPETFCEHDTVAFNAIVTAISNNEERLLLKLRKLVVMTRQLTDEEVTAMNEFASRTDLDNKTVIAFFVELLGEENIDADIKAHVETDTFTNDCASKEVSPEIKAQREELETAFLSAMKGKDFAPALASSVAPSRVLTAEEVAAVKDVISRIEEIGDTMQILSAVELIIGEENMESNVYGVCAQQQVRGDYK